MSELATNYLASTWNRDKVMAIVQFLPMALAGPTEKAGFASLAKSLSNLSSMADAYRAITRLSLLLGALSRPTLQAVMKPQGDVFVDRMTQINHFFHVLYCFFENNAVLASHGVTCNKLTRLGGCAVTCWFYVLLTSLIREIYLRMNREYSEEQKVHSNAAIIKFSCFLLFALGNLPKGGPQLLTSEQGVLLPVHKALQVIAPPHLSLSYSTRGLLGLIASICDFY